MLVSPCSPDSNQGSVQMASVFKFWLLSSNVCMLFHFKEIQQPDWSSLSVCLLVHALLACVAGILKGRKRVRQKEGNIHLSSSLPSRALYPATRAFCIQLLTLSGYSRALYLLARPLSNRARLNPPSLLLQISKYV